MRQLAPSHDEADEALAESNRTGLQIWDGVYGPNFDKSQAPRSYMSHALGPWLGRTGSLEERSKENDDMYDLPQDPFRDPEKRGALSSPVRPAGPRWPSSRNSHISQDDAVSSTNDHHATTEESFGIASSKAPSTYLTSDQSSIYDSKSDKPFAAALRTHTVSPSSTFSGSSFTPLSRPQAYEPLKRTST